MIDRVLFRNFRSFRRLDVRFGRLTAIVGPNGSGKTTILEGLEYLTAQRPEEMISELRRKEKLPLLFNRSESCSLELAGYMGKRGCRFSSEGYEDDGRMNRQIAADPNRELSIFARTDVIDPEQNVTEWERSYPLSTHSFLMSSIRLNLDASLLAAPSFNPVPRPQVGHSGRGLASALSYMALNQPDNFALIQAQLRSVIPSVERLRFDRVTIHRPEPETIKIDEDEIFRYKNNEYMCERIIFDMKGAPGLPSQQISEGTLLVLGLLTILMDLQRPTIILIDDLDHGLHPRAQKELVGLLRKFLENNPETQIVFTTHSPYLLDNLQSEEVLLTTLNDDGSSSCASLVDHPDFDRWKNEMSPGEMWTLFGEKWVAAQQA